MFASQNIKVQFKAGALSRVEKLQLVEEGMEDRVQIGLTQVNLKVVCKYSCDGIVYWYVLLKLAL